MLRLHPVDLVWWSILAAWVMQAAIAHLHGDTWASADEVVYRIGLAVVLILVQLLVVKFLPEDPWQVPEQRRKEKK